MNNTSTQSLAADTTQKLKEKNCQALDAHTAAMLEAQEIKAITGDQEEWWCPNPECKAIDE